MTFPSNKAKECTVSKNSIVPLNLCFRPGSVISYFSIIFNSPYYEMITPLIDAINQTNDNGTNHLGDMAIQLWNVDPVDGTPR